MISIDLTIHVGTLIEDHIDMSDSYGMEIQNFSDPYMVDDVNAILNNHPVMSDNYAELHLTVANTEFIIAYFKRIKVKNKAYKWVLTAP